jgi:hypothetical protein
MRYIFLTILSVLAAFILFFFALIYINIDVGIDNIQYTRILYRSLEASIKLHVIILPMHFWLSRKQKRKSKAR